MQAIFSPGKPIWNRDDLASIETPCYIFNPAEVVRSYRSLRASLGTPLLVSLKANPDPDLLECCASEFRDGVEVASLGELDTVSERLADAKYVTSPALDEALILAASACRATVVLDSEAHAKLLLQLQPRLFEPVSVMIRINATSLLRNCTESLKADHFGVEPADACTIVSRLHHARIRVVGLHVFVGSGNFARAAPYMVSAMTPLIDEVSARMQQQLPCANLGGGFTADWAEAPDLMRAYRNSLEPLRRRMTVLHEAGRAIFERAGKFLTRVVSVKLIHGSWVAVCDGGMAHAFQLAQTERFVKSWSEPTVIRKGVPDEGGATLVDGLPTRYVGNSCNPADVLGVAEKGAGPQIGDIVMFQRCGAYHTYTPSSFLNLAPARKYLNLSANRAIGEAPET